MANSLPIRSNDDNIVVNCISWNTRGINHIVKRNRVLSHLKTLDVNIAFLQETWLRTSDHCRLRKGWVGQVYHSNYQDKSRGAVILINKNTPFIMQNVIADHRGRSVVVTGTLYSVSVILASVYAPCWDDAQFMKTFLSSLPDLNTHRLILGGDFNCVLDPVLDRSSNTPYNITKSAKTINSFLQMYNMSDPLRFLYPDLRRYSFFSSVHRSYSRIDYFVIDSQLLTSVRDCRYEGIVISDHGPVVLQISFPKKITRRPWRFDNASLADEAFVNCINTKIDFFLSINDTPDVSRSTLWESLKAFLRGEIISYTSWESRTRKQRLKDLSNQIQQLDSRYSSSPTPDLFKERTTLQTEFDLLTTRHTEQLLLRSRSRLYEHSDKAGRILAQQIRQFTAPTLITSIRKHDGQISNDEQEINDEFKRFYSSLYASEVVYDPSKLDSFFQGITLPRISESFMEELEEPLSLEEIRSALYNMQNSKAPGPDGFTVEFLKKFGDGLLPVLLSVLEESFVAGHLPPTFCQASISVLLKKDKDPLRCGSFRPISLLDVDCKLLAKVLAHRLESTLPSIISPDQTGFIKKRLSFLNIRRLLNIMYSSEPNQPSPEAIISLDAEKAFDRVEWGYLFQCLERFGFGPKFISWVKLLYNSPTSSVRTNNINSQYFPLQRGTRQGCPASPLLFAIAIEPLAISLRSSPEVRGIYRGGREHKLSLYADDLLLYITDPQNTLPHIMTLLGNFSELSGYKINMSKSELFPINPAAQSFSFNSYPFKVAADNFIYLGVVVTRKISDLFKLNFAPLLERTRVVFDKWSMLPLSLAGRINLIKMITLPKFLYLFQTIPIYIKKSFFSHLNKIISDFIWNKKPPRIRKEFLQRPRLVGGMALPHFQFYYWAANLRALAYWLQTYTNGEAPDWVQMEADTCSPTSLPALLYSALPIALRHTSVGPLARQSLRMWAQVRRHFRWHAGSVCSPIAANHRFPPSLQDDFFLVWREKGIVSFKDLYITGTFASFDQLRAKFNLPGTHFFRYLQVRDWARNNTGAFPTIPEQQPIDILFSTVPSLKGTISSMYMKLSSMQTTSLDALREAWQADLNVQFADAEWSDVVSRIHSSSICARHSLIQFKVVHRLHLSKARISIMYPAVDDSCNRCKHSPATLAHTFWFCPMLSGYWSSIFEALTNVFEKPIHPNPLTAIFGIQCEDDRLPRTQSNCIAYVTLLARRLILLNWKQATPPSFKHWVRDTLQFLKLEKIRFALRGPKDNFISVWQPFITCLLDLL